MHRADERPAPDIRYDRARAVRRARARAAASVAALLVAGTGPCGGHDEPAHTGVAPVSPGSPGPPGASSAPGSVAPSSDAPAPPPSAWFPGRMRPLAPWVAELRKRVDPAVDGWPSEVVARAVEAKL